MNEGGTVLSWMDRITCTMSILSYHGPWCPAELKLHLVVEIRLLKLHCSNSAPEFYGICSNRSLVCTGKLAKVCCLELGFRNTSRPGSESRLTDFCRIELPVTTTVTGQYSTGYSLIPASST
jgi:hypothetical protein